MLEKIVEIMRDVCEIEDEITPESRFVEDLCLSSLEMFNFISEIEEEFDVSIPTRKLQGIQSVADLMDELSKIVRAIGKACPGAPHEVWLTVDASLGSNALSQAREFSKSANLTGLVLTKLDGSGKGGMAVAIHREFELPTFFTGFGEAPEDLQEFDAQMYAEALFQTPEN